MLKKIVSGVLAIFYVYLFIHFESWDFSDADSFVAVSSRILAIVTLVVLVAGMLGAIWNRSWVRRCLVAGNIVYLGFGIFVTHFSWTFWLFTEPTLKERIVDTAPYFLLGVVLPLIILFVLFKTRKNLKS